MLVQLTRLPDWQLPPSSQQSWELLFNQAVAELHAKMTREGGWQEDLAIVTGSPCDAPSPLTLTRPAVFAIAANFTSHLGLLGIVKARRP